MSNVQMFKCLNVQMFKCSNFPSSNVQMSVRLNFCRSVPSEYLRSVFSSSNIHQVKKTIIVTQNKEIQLDQFSILVKITRKITKFK